MLTQPLIGRRSAVLHGFFTWRIMSAGCLGTFVGVFSRDLLGEGIVIVVDLVGVLEMMGLHLLFGAAAILELRDDLGRLVPLVRVLPDHDGCFIVIEAAQAEHPLPGQSSA